MSTAEDADRLANELIVSGALFATLAATTTYARSFEDVTVVEDEDVAALIVRLPFMRSAYRVTVTMEPGTEREVDL